MTPIGAIVRGALAGAVGTLAMDLFQYAQARRDGTDESFREWERTDADSFEDAGAPAEVGRRTAEELFEAELPEETAGTVQDLVHWSTGVGYGVLHGLLAGSAERPRVAHGLITGPAAFAGSYTVLPMMGVYDPIWEYDAKTIAKGLASHVVYGLGTAVAFRVLAAGTGERSSGDGSG